MLRERRRPGQRHLEVDRRRRHVDAPHERHSRRPTRSHRPRRVSARTATSCTRRSKRRPPGRGGGGGRQSRHDGGCRRRRTWRRPWWRRAAAAAVRPASIAPTTAARLGIASWTTNPRPLYFSQVRIDPNNADRVYMGGVKMQLTVDGGKTVETSASLVAHDDIHAIWIDPANSDHVLIGDDGGVYQSYDGAKTWSSSDNLPVGLFYHVSYDMTTFRSTLRRHAGQLRLVRTEPVAPVAGHLQSRLVPDRGRRRIRRDSRPARLALDLQRVAGRQHDSPQQGHRRVEEHSPDARRT